MLLLGPGREDGVGQTLGIDKRQFDPPSRLPGSDHRRLSSPRAHHRITLHHITVYFRPTASLPSRNHPSPLPSSTSPSLSLSHLAAGARIVGLVHCLRPLHGRSRATRFFERASAQQPTALPSATSSHPGTPPSPAPAYTPAKAQECAVPSGQMRSNRAPHTVLQ
ncbi:hypothetical protein LA080_008688 [Diaporthe eres]|nr:hypothetical protein LA080_008688 [Diaporthe eres]